MHSSHHDGCGGGFRACDCWCYCLLLSYWSLLFCIFCPFASKNPHIKCRTCTVLYYDWYYWRRGVIPPLLRQSAVMMHTCMRALPRRGASLPCYGRTAERRNAFWGRFTSTCVTPDVAEYHPEQVWLGLRPQREQCWPAYLAALPARQRQRWRRVAPPWLAASCARRRRRRRCRTSSVRRSRASTATRLCRTLVWLRAAR